MVDNAHAVSGSTRQNNGSATLVPCANAFHLVADPACVPRPAKPINGGLPDGPVAGGHFGRGPLNGFKEVLIRRTADDARRQIASERPANRGGRKNAAAHRERFQYFVLDAASQGQWRYNSTGSR
jgi:hypothetical protein